MVFSFEKSLLINENGEYLLIIKQYLQNLKICIEKLYQTGFEKIIMLNINDDCFSVLNIKTDVLEKITIKRRLQELAEKAEMKAEIDKLKAELDDLKAENDNKKEQGAKLKEPEVKFKEEAKIEVNNEIKMLENKLKEDPYQESPQTDINSNGELKPCCDCTIF